MKRKGLNFSIGSSWQFASTAIIVIAGIGLLLFGNIGSLLPGYSKSELSTAEASRSLSVILNDPVNAPYKSAVKGVSVVTDDIALSARIVSGMLGVGTLVLFYLGLRRWYNARIAFITTVLFGCSAWFLHTARLGTADIMLPFTVLLLAYCGYLIAEEGHRKAVYIFAALAAALSIFVPGMIWLFVAAAIVRRGKDFRNLHMHLSWPYKLLLALFGLAIVAAPILMALYQSPQTSLALLGLPANFPDIVHILKDIALVPLSIFVWSESNPDFTLGHLPFVDVFATGMFILGAYFYFKYRTLDRTKMLAVFAALSAVLVGLGGPVSVAILLPGVYIVVGAGLALMLAQWITVFPRNQLAQSVGIVLLSVAVAISCLYNIRSYFVAWTHNETTRANFSQDADNLLQ